jgi:hypothetical protein
VTILITGATPEETTAIRETLALAPQDFVAANVTEVVLGRFLRPWIVGGINGHADRGWRIKIKPGLPLSEVRRVTAHEFGHIWPAWFRAHEPPEHIYRRFPEALLREWSYTKLFGLWKNEGLAKLIRIALRDPLRLFIRSPAAWAAWQQLWRDTTDAPMPELPVVEPPPPVVAPPPPPAPEPPPIPSGKTQVERWRALVHATAQAARATGLSTATDAQTLAQIEQESEGDPDARSPVNAHGLGQVMGQEDPRFADRPSRRWLIVPNINVAWMVYMMGDAMARSKARGDSKPWEHALLEYYTGSLDGWDREYGGASGRDYVELVSAKVSTYTRLPSFLRRALNR